MFGACPPEFGPKGCEKDKQGLLQVGGPSLKQA